MTEQDMQEQIRLKVYKYMGLFYEHFLDKAEFPIANPDIEFGDLGNEAGQCGYCCDGFVSGFVKFNTSAIKANFQRYMDYIVGHEVAHWCVATMFGNLKDDDNLNHKGVWKYMMEFFECEAVEYLNPFICAPIKGMHMWKCGCSAVNFNEEENSEAHEWGVECENCKQDYVYHGVNK